jgi:uncharacterized protein (TIGR04255 family)
MGEKEQGPRPPVNEVILSVVFDQREELLGPQLPAILGRWYDEHPLVQVAPPYEMPVERPQIAPAGPPSIRLFEAPTKPRYWLRTADEGEVVQVQHDYLALGWRRRDLGREYVRYETLRGRFADLLEQVSSNVPAGIQPRRAEISYTNAIEPNSVWSHPGEVHKLLAVAEPPGGDYEQMSVTYTRPLMADEVFAGRQHVSIQPEFALIKQEPRLSLTIICRSADFEEPSIDAALRFLDMAHVEANHAFLDLLTDDARRLWGFE